MSQCKGVTRSGRQCRRNVDGGGYCDDHAVAHTATHTEVDERVSEILAFILRGHRRSAIEDYARQKWGIKRSAVSKYITRARCRYREIADEHTQDVYAWSVATRLDLLAEARHVNDHRVALAILKDIAKLHGLYDKAQVTPIDITTRVGTLAAANSLVNAMLNGQLPKGTLNAAAMLINIANKTQDSIGRNEQEPDKAAQTQLDADALDDVPTAEIRKTIKLLTGGGHG